MRVNSYLYYTVGYKYKKVHAIGIFRQTREVNQIGTVMVVPLVALRCDHV